MKKSNDPLLDQIKKLEESIAETLSDHLPQYIFDNFQPLLAAAIKEGTLVELIIEHTGSIVLSDRDCKGHRIGSVDSLIDHWVKCWEGCPIDSNEVESLIKTFKRQISKLDKLIPDATQ